MVIELNKATFKRLVWLYILSAVFGVGVYIFEYLDPTYSAFVEEFDALVTKYDGSVDDISISYLVLLGVIISVDLIWAVASVVGIMKFKRWGRFGFWASFVLFLPLMAVPSFYPAVTSAMNEFLMIVSTSLFGAILILAYADGYGNDWFNPPQTNGI